MKAKKIIVAFVAMLALTIAMPVESGATPPSWAPAHGYREKTRQIYFPEQNFYYDLHQGVYLYMNGRNWAASASLPVMYRNVNLRVAPQVQLTIHNSRPYIYNHNHRTKYWNSRAQNDYYKRMAKNNHAYQRDMYKMNKKYQKAHNKTIKNHRKYNEKHDRRW